MARCLTWCDLSKEHLLELKDVTDHTTLERLVASIMRLPSHETDGRQGILLDMYLGALRYAKKMGFDVEKTSSFFSIVKVNHYKAVDDRLTLENSFAYFKNLILQHSVQRPPFSLGIFPFKEVKDITDYMLDTYYRHYKLYQYAYTKRFTLDICAPGPLVETLPELLPLADALSSKKWQDYEEEVAAAAAEKQAAEDRAAAEAAEELRLHAAEVEFANAIPDEVYERVRKVFEEKMVGVKAEMEEQFKLQEESLLSKINVLEDAAAQQGLVTAKPTTPSGGKKKK
mmetsp:Transcript_39861/g.55379  ORF Transcript_39861/g.55379 Transcript_39861/m.55379 type:complete len:285 (-) Transcript_39861:105-959(-)|eukprot:CAMPEP_0196590638 /NCGR_PEP_ID=MMETSP1081-20130531/67139_1 /TAXON_ID=36882 /ORGANISM="Pyramimonas amylifera, Strain CCMP720" /LENGTH=284 /DNA_ID=CAMNT_0041913793 /DNA_START=110 /DNA_END=964 /DNA_ORIENTATION=-